ncbi:MAG TPA: bifunctional DNA-formamidopyrimidine glycosylase/DNA-(apurinic or apyrimidinic site) lyase [Longimicrobiales bacterium]|nr:bifunctional DNA-formamidopyrimidine glycosylase/DNA-(apurinic or apyrimidinic site) lyase [Longimicrobiales bacterium]
MPELPEAETIVRDLQRRVIGRRIDKTKVIKADIIEGVTPAKFSRAVNGHTIRKVSRRAKKIVIELSGDAVLVVSLGMTGRIVLSNSARAHELRHVAVRLDLDDGTALLYDDARRFGSLEAFTTKSWNERQTGLGLEPLGDEFTPDIFYRLMRTSISPIRNWLLDQKRVVGIGNIYAAEALYRAGIRPTRKTKSLTKAEASRLRDKIRDVLFAAIKKRGTTLSDYRDASGEEGAFVSRLQVYDRGGLPCPKCKTPIKRLVLSNRSAFYCPTCQR